MQDKNCEKEFKYIMIMRDPIRDMAQDAANTSYFWRQLDEPLCHLGPVAEGNSIQLKKSIVIGNEKP